MPAQSLPRDRDPERPGPVGAEGPRADPEARAANLAEALAPDREDGGVAPAAVRAAVAEPQREPHPRLGLDRDRARGERGGDLRASPRPVGGPRGAEEHRACCGQAVGGSAAVGGLVGGSDGAVDPGTAGPVEAGVALAGGRRRARLIAIERGELARGECRAPGVDARQRALRTVHALPGERPRGHRVGHAVDGHAGEIVVVPVGHPGGRRAVVHEAHDAGDGVHAEVDGVVLATRVEHLLPLGHGSAVGPQEGADSAHRAAAIHEERSLSGGKGRRAATAEVGTELILVAVEDVGAARADAQAALPPAVDEGARVAGRDDGRALRCSCPAANL